jgi:hypothetical protein
MGLTPAEMAFAKRTPPREIIPRALFASSKMKNETYPSYIENIALLPTYSTLTLSNRVPQILQVLIL